MASDIKEAIRRMIYRYVVEGADEVMATQEAVAASTTKTDKASLSLEKAFGSLERRYVETVRHQQDYQKVQEKVNAAVAQNPALQERANAVLAAASQHFDNLASKGNFFTEIVTKGFTKFLGPMALVNLALTGIGAAIGYMAAQWESSAKTTEQVLEEQNRLLKESTKLIDGKTAAQERMFAQSKDVLTYQNLQNEQQIRIKINEALQESIRLAERRATTPTQVAGEMGEAPTGVAPLKDPGSERIIAAQQQLQATIAQGLPGFRAYNEELARIGQAYPEITKTINELLKIGLAGQQQEDAANKSAALDAALKGVATAAQLAALGMKTFNENLISQRGMAEAAAAAERMADAMVKLSEKYPGMTLDTAKQLELLDAQLKVARARTEEEKLLAEEKKRVLELTLQQGKSAEEALEIAKKERQIAEEIVKQKEEQADATQRVADATHRQVDAAQDVAEATDGVVDATQRLVSVTVQYVDTWKGLRSIVDAVADRLPGIVSQFDAAGYVSTWDPGHFIDQKKALEELYGAENVQRVDFMAEGANMTFPVWLPDLEKLKASAQASRDKIDSDLRAQFPDAFAELDRSLKGLTSSTDSLNATMQNALSPFYSQDPRTTKLGFRAGVVGNPDWLAPGASNANPLAAILGPGATAPGMASGGSFIVGGGYSANDNKIAAFPVASGEQVVVNRNPGGARVVNIDNRIIVAGAVDGDALSKLKVSRYQQTQRMRAGLARA